MNPPLFIIGNKRSGTSLLVSLLNLHSEIFIAHEADIIWILYQFHRHQVYQPYVYDNPAGMNDTLKRCGYLLSQQHSPAENFNQVLECLMTRGSAWTKPMPGKQVTWLGDKKPFQNMDPELIPFIMANFPGVRFIHLVRHPFAMAISAKKFKNQDGREMWENMSPQELTERWAMHERWALKLKEDSRAKVLTVKYEDLCKKTARELRRIFEFLDLPVDKKILKQGNKITAYFAKSYPQIPVSAETVAIMKQYGYEAEGLKRSKLVTKLLYYFWKFRKQF